MAAGSLALHEVLWRKILDGVDVCAQSYIRGLLVERPHPSGNTTRWLRPQASTVAHAREFADEMLRDAYEVGTNNLLWKIAYIL